MLARNRYFWGGLLVLFVLLGGLFLLMNHVVMPTLTRHNVAITLPDVTGRSFEEARQLLLQEELEVERTTQRFNPTLPRDVVIDQSPEPNATVKPGRRIYLTVNSGTQSMVQIPPLVDASLREARNRLTALGLEVEDVRVDSIPSPYANVVTRQEPVPGDSLPEGGGVTLWYSTGYGEEYVSVPDVTDMTVEEAQQALLDRKLRSMVIASDASSDDDNDAESGEALDDERVQRQSREPGTRVRTGFEIRLYLGGPPSDSTAAGNA